MARDESDDEDQDDDELHISFKKLKVDPDWDKSHQQSQCVDIHSIWSGETSNLKYNEPSHKHPKHGVSPSHRTEPYPAECVLSFERLCLRKEKCSKKWCLCKYDKSKNASTSSVQKLNYAVAVSGQRKLIHDARLKLHHAQKDHRQIIRAAKLQINEAKKVKAGKEHSKKNKEKGELKVSTPDRVFGSVSNFEAKNFVNVKSTGGNNSMSVNDLPEKHFFDGHRGLECTASTSGFISKSLSNDNGYSAGTSNKASSSSDTSLTKVEKSCSQEATIEDLSVDELAGYFDDFVHIPKKMSVMAEMMYT